MPAKGGPRATRGLVRAAQRGRGARERRRPVRLLRGRRAVRDDSDVGGVLFALTLIAPAWWLHQATGIAGGTTWLRTAVGILGMIGLAAVQTLFLAGAIANFSLALPFTGLIGAWFVLWGIDRAAWDAWPAWVRWAAILSGIGLVVSVTGLWLGSFHPIAQAGYALGGIADIAWAVGFGRRLLRGD